MSQDTFKTPKSYYDIPGFFWWLDRKIFSAVLESQSDQPPGDIVELGTYMGKSTVILGNHLRDGERLVALDLFGSNEETDGDNRRENERYYKPLNRTLFERYYLALHSELPYIVQAPSSVITDHVGANEARFVHVDASHLFAHVHVDVQSTKQILRPGGLAVFDDYRTEHTPGVSAAVWEAVFTEGFVPVAVTPQKMYGMFDGEPEPYVSAMRTLVDEVETFRCVDEEILGLPVLRIGMNDKAAKPKRSQSGDVRLSDDDVRRIADAVALRLSAEPRLPTRMGMLRRRPAGG